VLLLAQRRAAAAHASQPGSSTKKGSTNNQARAAARLAREEEKLPRSALDPEPPWNGLEGLPQPAHEVMNPLDAYVRRWPCECGPYLAVAWLREGQADWPKSA
jgi:hypothetical protein